MQTIGGVSRNEVLSVAEEVVKVFLTLPENKKPERTGGYLTIRDKLTGKIYFINEIGLCLPEMDEKCFRFSQEKVNRLCNANLMLGHISAWQSRDREQYRYGGAIMAPSDSLGLEAGRNLIGGFSGIDEHSEETILLVIWIVFQWITLEDAGKITAISGNPLFEPLLKAYRV